MSINYTTDIDNVSPVNQYPDKTSFADSYGEIISIKYEANPMPLAAYNICTNSITGNSQYLTRSDAFTSPYESTCKTEPSYYQITEGIPENTLSNYHQAPTTKLVPECSNGKQLTNRTYGTLRPSSGIRWKYTPMRARITLSQRDKAEKTPVSAKTLETSTQEKAVLSATMIHSGSVLKSPRVERNINQMQIHAPKWQPAADVAEASSVSTGSPINFSEGTTALPLVPGAFLELPENVRRYIRNKIKELTMEPNEDFDQTVAARVPQQPIQDKESRKRIADTSPMSLEVSSKNAKTKKQKYMVLMAMHVDGSFSESGEMPEKTNHSESALTSPVINTDLPSLSPEVQKKQSETQVQCTAPQLVAAEKPPVSSGTSETSSQNETQKEELVSGDSAPATASVTSEVSKMITGKGQLKPVVVSEWLCSPCNKMFRRQNGLHQDEQQLQEHQVRHTAKEKPYKCLECPLQYYHLIDLKRHIELYHGASRHVCKYCKTTIARQDHRILFDKTHENGTVTNKVNIPT